VFDNNLSYYYTATLTPTKQYVKKLIGESYPFYMACSTYS